MSNLLGIRTAKTINELFSKSVAALEQESGERTRKGDQLIYPLGLSLESKKMILLREYILEGNWDGVDTLVDQLEVVHASEKVEG